LIKQQKQKTCCAPIILGSLHEKRWQDLSGVASWSPVHSAYISLSITGQNGVRRLDWFHCRQLYCTASADLSLCDIGPVGQAKLAATVDMDSTINHKQLVKASRQDTTIFRETIVIRKKV